MRSLVVVAMTILALDVTVVAIDVFERPVQPTIDAREPGRDPDPVQDSISPSPQEREDPSELAHRAMPSESDVPTEPASPTPVHRESVTEPEEPPTRMATAAPPAPAATSSAPTSSQTPTASEPAHGQVMTEDDGRVTVEIDLPKTRFAPGETIPFSLHVCNRTDEAITWGHPAYQDHPLLFHFARGNFYSEGPESASLRNGERPGHAYNGPEKSVEIPAHDCLTWSGRWEQTLDEFDFDGSSDGEPFPPGEVVAGLTLEGAAEGADIRHPEYYVTLLIG